MFLCSTPCKHGLRDTQSTGLPAYVSLNKRGPHDRWRLQEMARNSEMYFCCSFCALTCYRSNPSDCSNPDA